MWLGTLLVALAAPHAAYAAPADEAAVAVVETLHRSLVEVAALEPSPDLATRVELLAPVVRSTHDLTTMARLTVRRFWRELSEAERAAFVDAFERFSVTTYASRFASIGPESFGILSSEVLADDRVEVHAVIHRTDDPDVPMDYTLRHDGERWRIINILADGASELSIMASEFYTILEAGDLGDLLAELRARTAEL